MDDYEPDQPDHSDSDDNDFELSLDERLSRATPAAVPSNITGKSELERDTDATLRILDAMGRIGRGEPVGLDVIEALDDDYARIRLKWAPPPSIKKEEKK